MNSMINEYNMVLGNKVIYNLRLNLQVTLEWSFYLWNFDEEVGEKNNKRHFLYQVSKRTAEGFKHHPLPGALPVWEIIKIPFPSLVIKPEWGM